MAGIYIHIPFCHSKCAYCDFYSTPKNELAEKFTSALLNEWEERKCELSGDVTTVYFGGGTPSSLPVRLLDRIVEVLPLDRVREMTIEVNPEDVTRDFVSWLARSPFNRVSMGVQSLDDTELRTVGRRHTSAGARQAVELLRAAGVDNMSLDLIYGLPGQTLESWMRSLKGMMEMRPEHLSAYLLSYEPGTRLTAMLSAGKIKEADEGLVEQMYASLCRVASDNGYDHYEISNFAQPGCRAVHNSSYWDMTPYLGLGPAAHSFDGVARRCNPANLKRYVDCEGRGFAVVEKESEDERFNDRVITSLRTAVGLPLDSLDEDSARRLMEDARKWIDRGVLRVVDGHLSFDPSRWLISDRVLVDLIRV